MEMTASLLPQLDLFTDNAFYEYNFEACWKPSATRDLDPSKWVCAGPNRTAVIDSPCPPPMVDCPYSQPGR